MSRKKADVTPSAPTRIFSIHPRPPIRGAVWHHVPSCDPPQHGGQSCDVCVTVSRRRVRRRTLHVSLAAPRRRASAQWPGTKMAAPSGALWTSLLLVTAALALAGAVSEPTTVPFDVRPGGVVHSFSQDVGPGVSAEPPSGASPTGHCRDWTEPVPVRPGARRNVRGGVIRRPATQRGVAASAAACQALPTYTAPSPRPAHSGKRDFGW